MPCRADTGPDGRCLVLPRQCLPCHAAPRRALARTGRAKPRLPCPAWPGLARSCLRLACLAMPRCASPVPRLAKPCWAWPSPAVPAMPRRAQTGLERTGRAMIGQGLAVPAWSCLASPSPAPSSLAAPCLPSLACLVVPRPVLPLPGHASPRPVRPGCACLDPPSRAWPRLVLPCRACHA